MATRRKRSMNPLLRTLLWCLLALMLLVTTDQALVRAPIEQPALRAVQAFYRDFRARLAGLWRPATVEGVIERERRQPPSAQTQAPLLRPAPAPVPAPAPTAPPTAAGGRFLYVDQDGQLQFADSIEDIPPRYRGGARPMQP